MPGSPDVELGANEDHLEELPTQMEMGMGREAWGFERVTLECILLHFYHD